MSDEPQGEGDVRLPHAGWEDDAPTMVARPKKRKKPAAGELPDQEPELHFSEETVRIRPDQVDRRALPFKRPGDRRHPEAGAAQASPPAFASSPPPAGGETASVWSNEAVIDRQDLPSALAPPSEPPAAPREKAEGDALPLVIGAVVLLVGLAAVLFLIL